MNYKMILAYDGTRYNGWQKQGNTDRTIQGKLEQILTGQGCSCGRSDSKFPFKADRRI